MSALDRGVWMLLRGVSRSMYLSLRALPAGVRDSMGLGYLLCRAADTIADTRLVPKDQRLKAVERYREAFGSGSAVRLDVRHPRPWGILVVRLRFVVGVEGHSCIDRPKVAAFDELERLFGADLV